MAIVIKDSGGTDVDFVRESFSMEDAVTQRGTLSFQHIGTTRPLEWGEDVFVYDGASKIWGGTVDSWVESDITVAGNTELRFTYRCVDFSQLAARAIIATQYVDQTAGAIVTALAGNGLLVNFGVSAGTIHDGVTIDSISFNYLPIETCLDDLAELSGFFWDIDKDKNLNFRPVDAAAAPFDITSSNRPYRSITFQETRGQYVNQVFVRAGTTLDSADTTETQLGDGNKRTFVVGAPIGSTPTIEVDTGGGFSTQTVGVNGIGTSSQWYYNVGSSIVVHDSSETVLGATDKVRVTFKGRFPIIVFAVEEDALTERSAVETGNGTYQRVIDAQDLASLDEAELRAKAILEQYSQARLTCSYVTDTAGLEAGQTQTINLTEHGINANFLIEKVSASMLSDGTLRYNVDAAATQTVAGWSYWKQKTRQDRKFVVRDNEVLNNLARPSDDITIADAPSTATSGVDGFNVGASSIVGLVSVG